MTSFALTYVFASAKPTIPKINPIRKMAKIKYFGPKNLMNIDIYLEFKLLPLYINRNHQSLFSYNSPAPELHGARRREDRPCRLRIVVSGARADVGLSGRPLRHC